jgi:serine protease Do
MRRTLLLSALFLATAAPAASAQARTPAPARVGTYAYSTAGDPDRAMLGVSTSSDGKRDTLGLLVTSVTEGGPAEKAGIEEGNRIGSVNGVSLKLSHADAGESDMSGVMTNRLVREMRKLHAGDEATLEVWASGRYKTVKVKTVAADDLSPMRPFRINDDERPALGISVSASGSKRDTLGVFVSRVTEDGPAEKAGITEGDRISSINGVDLRTAREDAGDGWVGSNKVQRLQREIGKLKVGQVADLIVVSGGRSHPVKVTVARARDLKDWGNGFSVHIGDGMGMGMGASTPFMNFDGLRQSLRNLGPQIKMQLDQEMPRAMDEMRMQLDREMPRAMDDLKFNLERDLPRAMDDLKFNLDRELPRAMDEMRAQLKRELPRAMDEMHFQLDRELPSALDELHRQLDQFRLDGPPSRGRIRIATPPVNPAGLISMYKQRVVI